MCGERDPSGRGRRRRRQSHHHDCGLDHGGPRLSRREFAALVGVLLASTRAAGAAQALPDLGNSSDTALSPAADKELGQAFMRQIRAESKVMDDPEVEGHVQSIGHRLASQSDVNTSSYYYFVIEQDQINAFAGPGGHVAIYTGLILDTQNEGELAAVIAHETAHVLQHHIARGMATSDRMRIPVIAALAASVLLGLTTSATAGAASARAVMGAAVQSRLAFSRSIEEEADEVGMQLLHRAGYDPNAMPDFFERLERATRYWSQPPEFLQNHPVTTARIADSRARAAQYPPPTHPYHSSFVYYLMKAKIAVAVESEPRKAASDAEALLKSGQYEKKAAARYRVAIALDRAGRQGEARKIVDALIAKDPDNTWYQTALGRIEANAGDLRGALKVYGDGLELYPDNKAMLYGYTEALLQTGQAAKAVRTVEDYGRGHDLNAHLYWLLAEGYDKTGHHAESLLALSEHYYRKGQLDLAIMQLEKAQRASPGDFYQTSRADARLQALREEKKALAKR